MPRMIGTQEDGRASEPDWLAARKGELGRAWRRKELYEVGVTRRGLERQVAAGALIRVRYGVYATPELHPALRTAIASGSRLACQSAAAAAGLWTRFEQPLHLQCSRRGAEHAHWADLPFPEEVEPWTVGTHNALWQAARCLPFVEAVAIWDSALHRRQVSATQLEAVVEALPVRYREIAEWVDGRAESGLETALRCLLRRAGYRLEPQFPLGRGRRADGRLGSVILEADGRDTHLDRERDYERDLEMARRGFATLRFTGDMVWRRQDAVVEAVEGLLGPEQAGTLRSAEELFPWAEPARSAQRQGTPSARPLAA